MRLLLLLVAAGWMLGAVDAQSELLRWLNEQYDVVRKAFQGGLLSTGSASRRLNNRESFARSLREDTPRDTRQSFYKKFQDIVPPDQPFPCDLGGRSPTRPTSVHRLRPGDIDVIGAMGDSLTASNGAGAANMLEVYIENRGMSWSAGGESTWREYVTLPNILKEFNPDLIGYSLRDSAASEKASQFNVAEPNAISSDMLFQAKLLERRMRTDKRVDYERDWKMVTIMTGANDFCSHMCYMKNPSDEPTIHLNGMTEALNYLRDNMPRLIVNLVPPPHLKALRDIPDFGPECYISHEFECPCMFGLQWKHLRDNFTAIMEAVQEMDMELSMSSAYSDKEDFAVVGQPFLMNPQIPTKTSKSGKVKTDFNYLTHDCFHFSQKAQALAGNSLWNSLLEPVGNKSTQNVYQVFEKFLCPTEEHPFIFTNRNS